MYNIICVTERRILRHSSPTPPVPPSINICLRLINGDRLIDTKRLRTPTQRNY